MLTAIQIDLSVTATYRAVTSKVLYHKVEEHALGM